MDVKKFGVEDLARLLDEGQQFPERRPVLLLGAGASYNHLPVVAGLKERMVRWLLSRVPNNSEARTSRVLARLEQPHITLEVLCSLFRYRSGRREDGRPRFDVARFWRELCAGAGYNSFSRSLAVLSREGLLGPILTSNFDEMLADAYSHSDPPVEFQYTTIASLQRNQLVSERVQEIIAFHGTIHRLHTDDLATAEHSPPTSALARGLAALFPNVLRSALLTRLTSDAPIIVIGYRGGDHFDMNPLIETIGIGEGQSSKWHWVSRNADPSNSFSRFIQKRFSGQFVHADPHELFPTYCREKLGIDTTSAPPERTWEDRIDCAFEAAYSINQDFQIPESICEAILSDLEHNLPGAWVVLEHYYLFSNSFLQDETLTFGGIDEENRSVDHLNFLSDENGEHGSSYGELLLAQHLYWEEDKASKRRTPEERLKLGYPLSQCAFKQVEDRITRMLMDSISIPRPEYHAVLLVGLAYAADYLGLIENKTRMALDELCEKAASEGLKVDLQLYYCRLLDEARERALQYFRRCISYAQEARSLLENTLGSAEAKDLGDLVQHELWAMIGEENVARALPSSTAWRSFKTAIERRLALLKSDGPLGEGEYRCSHLTQLFLRASEMVKVLLHIQTDTQPPQRRREQLPEDEQKALDEALAIAREAFYDYSKQVAPTADRRFPAYFEAEIVYHASCGDIKKARDAFERLQSAYQTAPEKIRTSTRLWMDNAEKRFHAIETMLSE